MKIFVQIASYRDPQLIQTIEDMISKAKFPENLRIGICRQYHPDDKFDDLSQRIPTRSIFLPKHSS